MDPSTNEQEFSKSPIEGSTQRHDSGVDNQGDISSHDSDMIAYESNELVHHPLKFLFLVTQFQNQK